MSQEAKIVKWNCPCGNSYTFHGFTEAPPKREWQVLTDEEMHECWGDPLTPLGMKCARAIEAKLKEKNT